jgi:hypothetical protein
MRNIHLQKHTKHSEHNLVSQEIQQAMFTEPLRIKPLSFFYDHPQRSREATSRHLPFLKLGN